MPCGLCLLVIGHQLIDNVNKHTCFLSDIVKTIITTTAVISGTSIPCSPTPYKCLYPLFRNLRHLYTLPSHTV